MLFFTKEKQKGNGSSREGLWGKTGKSIERENLHNPRKIIQLHTYTHHCITVFKQQLSRDQNIF